MRQRLAPWVITVFALVLGCLVGLPTTHSHAQTQTPVRLAVEGGFDSYFREGDWTPLLIRVSNDGAGIVGELRVVSGGAIRLNTGGYSVPIELPTQSSKQLFLYVALEVFTQQLQVELVDTDGVIIQSATAQLARVNAGDLLFASVTESPTGKFDLIAGRTSADPVQANLDMDNLPPLAQALESIDLLLLDDVDSGKLSLDRRRAIEDWVLAGGHLIVGGGPNWQKTRAGFDTLLPISVNTTVTLNQLDSLARFVGFGDDQKLESAAGVVVATGGLQAGAQVLAEQDGVPLIVRRGFGLGTVSYVAFDVSLEPFRSWTRRGQVWMSLLGTLANRPGWSSGVVENSDAVRAVNYTRALRLPDVLQLVLFLGLYIIVIGPLNYLVLRVIRRSNLAWVTIPAIILITSVIAYAVGSTLRGTLPTMSRMSLVQQWPESPRARLDGVTGLLAPRRGLYSVEAEEGVVMRPLTGENGSAIKMTEGAKFAANNFRVDSGTSANFMTSGYIQPIALDGNATVQIKENTLSVSGEVRNNSTLTITEAIVFAVNTPFRIGDLAPGETRPFNFEATILEFAAPSLANGPLNSNSLPPGSYNTYRYSRELALSNILISGFANLRNETPTEVNERRRREFFTSAMTDQVERGAARGVDVYFAGWTTVSPVNITIRDTTNFNAEDLTLYLIKLPTKTGAASNLTRLFPGYTLWTPIERGSRDYAPYSLYVIGNDAASFRFAPLNALRLKDVTSLMITIRSDGGGAGVVALWDWKAAKWIDLPTSPGSRPIEIRGSDVARYLLPDGGVRVQVRAPNTAISFERVDVVFNGTFTN